MKLRAKARQDRRSQIRAGNGQGSTVTYIYKEIDSDKDARIQGQPQVYRNQDNVCFARIIGEGT